MSPPPNIAVIGAGPAGCTFARLLIRASIPVTIFEGEASFSCRAQGGTLALHADSGLKVLREAGLLEEFANYARYDGEALRVTDKTLKTYMQLKGTSDEQSSRGKPAIDRARLRQILVESLPSDAIRWGCRLRSIDPYDLSLHFDHGIERGFDLVVGADGAWSKVRSILTDVRPDYVGLGGFDLLVVDAEKRYPHLHQLVNRGTVFAYSDSKAIFGQQKGDGSIIVSAYGPRDEDWRKTCGYDLTDAGAVKKAISQDYADWAEPLVEMVQVANEDELVPRSIYTLPVGVSWEHHPKTTLIGDAAHLMTPYAGKGVNTALVDASNLAHTIIESANAANPLENLDAGVITFEKDMFARAAQVQDHSNTNMELMFFTPGAPFTTIHRWVKQGMGSSWFVKVFVPLWLIRLVLRLLFWW